MQQLFITISSSIALLGYIVYAIAIIKGQAKPHRTTRFVVLLIEALATASLIAQGNTVAVWLPAAFTLGSIFIFILSIKSGMGGWEKTDLLCLVIALAGILLWKITANPVYALFFSIGADFSGIVPTLIKTYRFPHTEVWTFFAIGVLASLFSLLAVRNWAIEEYIYPLYIVVIDSVLLLLVLRKRIFRLK